MKLLIFLGNPGEEYSKTRHNAGFVIGDKIIDTLKPNVIAGKWKGLLYKLADFLVLKPQTFMNISGQSVSIVKNFYNIESKDIFVFYDDIDLDFGKVKIKFGGSSGGHNGIKSIDNSIGKDYFRVRIGIDRPSNINVEIADYVLTKFNNVQFNNMINIADKICSLINRFNEDLADLNKRSKLINDLNQI